MSGMNNAGFGLNNPTTRGTDYKVPPGLGSEEETESEEQETYEEEELSTRND